jgi:hypothetical protein
VSRDLQDRLYAIDDADAYFRSDDRLASWAHGVVDEPETERDLGELADWSCEVTERRT